MTLKLVYLLVSVVCICASQEEGGLTDYDIDEKVIGGHDASTNNYKLPYVATIDGYTERGKHIICSGAIYRDNMILTTAQCVKNFRTLRVRLGYLSESFPGPHYQEFKDIDQESIVKHPSFNEETGAHNLAVIKLKRLINMTAINSPALTSQSSYNYLNGQYMYSVYAAGFGRTDDEDSADSLQITYVTVKTQKECKEYLTNHDIKLRSANVYCVVNDFRGHCYGDEGAPLMYPYSSYERTYYSNPYRYVDTLSETHYLIAITSQVVPLTYGKKDCRDVLVIYMRIASYLPWLKSLN